MVMFLLAITSGYEEEVLQQITTNTPSSTQKHQGVNSPEFHRKASPIQGGAIQWSLQELLVPFRLPKLSWLKPADEGLIGIHTFFEFGPRKTVRSSLNFALEKPRSLPVNPTLSSKLECANSFAHSRTSKPWRKHAR
jgi:hypothetical protein